MKERMEEYARSFASLLYENGYGEGKLGMAR